MSNKFLALGDKLYDDVCLAISSIGQQIKPLDKKEVAIVLKQLLSAVDCYASERKEYDTPLDFDSDECMNIYKSIASI